MDTEIIAMEQCPHPEIVEDRTLMSCEYIYYCSACYKKIIIPTSTLLEIKREGILGIIGLTFGERWKQQLSRYT